MFRSLGVMLGVVAALAGRERTAQQTYRRADVDSSGQLRIIVAGGRTIRPPTDRGQVDVGQIAISPDRRTVGWVALYSNEGPTYPIPLELVLLTAGTARTVVGNGLPIWQWAFSADGRRVVLRQAPLHGAAPAHYELREILTGGLVSSFDAEAAPSRALPRWVRGLSPPP